jgi:hypothetical protein
MRRDPRRMSCTANCLNSFLLKPHPPQSRDQPLLRAAPTAGAPSASAEPFAGRNLLTAQLVARLSKPLLNGKRLEGIVIPAAKLAAE